MFLAQKKGCAGKRQLTSTCNDRRGQMNCTTMSDMERVLYNAIVNAGSEGLSRKQLERLLSRRMIPAVCTKLEREGHIESAESFERGAFEDYWTVRYWAVE